MCQLLLRKECKCASYFVLNGDRVSWCIIMCMTVYEIMLVFGDPFSYLFSRILPFPFTNMQKFTESKHRMQTRWFHLWMRYRNLFSSVQLHKGITFTICTEATCFAFMFLYCPCFIICIKIFIIIKEKTNFKNVFSLFFLFGNMK